MADTVEQARLRRLLEAEQEIIRSQEWQDGTLKNRRADLKSVTAEINKLRAAGVTLDDEVTVPSNRRRGMARRVIFID